MRRVLGAAVVALFLVTSLAPAATAFGGRPSGTRIAFITTTAPGPQVATIREDGSHRHLVTEGSGTPFSVDWSPGGSRLAYSRDTSDGSVIFTVAPDGGDRRRLTDGARDLHPSWSPGGTRIAFTRCCPPEQNVFAVNVDTREVSRLTRRPRRALDPSWSPDGRRVAFAEERRFSTNIVVYDIVSGTYSTLRRHRTDLSPAWSPDGDTIAFSRGSGAGRTSARSTRTAPASNACAGRARISSRPSPRTSSDRVLRAQPRPVGLGHDAPGRLGSSPRDPHPRPRRVRPRLLLLGCSRPGSAARTRTGCEQLSAKA
jgi:dipeptidyl aminopeptidase/acylaminoacyl peptidase